MIIAGHLTWTELDTIMSLDDVQLFGMSVDYLHDKDAARERGERLRQSDENLREIAATERKTPKRRQEREA